MDSLVNYYKGLLGMQLSLHCVYKTMVNMVCWWSWLGEYRELAVIPPKHFEC